MTITVTFDNLVEFNSVINRNEAPAVAAPKAAPVTTPVPAPATALANTPKKPVKAEAGPVKEEAPATHSALNIEIVREKVSELTRNNKKDEVKALLETYGAKSVTLLEPAKYEAFVADLSAL